jgi:DNA polymerase III delta prime subunit
VESEKVKKIILARYKRLYDFAGELGVDPSQVSRWIRKPTKKFMAILINKGIIEEENKNIDEIKINENDKSEIINNLKTIIFEKEKIVEKLLSIIEYQDRIIEEYKKKLGAEKWIKELKEKS